MEMLKREDIKNENYGKYSVKIPKYFLERVNALDCEYVRMEVIDKRHILIKLLKQGDKGSFDSDMVKLSEVRKIMCKTNNTNIIAFPPYFMKSMNAENCKHVNYTIPDEEHFMAELVE